MRYKFRYFGVLPKIALMFLVPVQNFVLVRMLCFLIFFLTRKLFLLIGIEDYVLSETVISGYKNAAFILSLSSAVIYLVLKKGVFLNENNLIVARYAITPFDWRLWIKIDYRDIEKVNVNYFDISWYDFNFRMLTLGSDRAYNVELTLKNGKKYFLSIEDQEEFCDNLNQLIEISKI